MSMVNISIVGNLVRAPEHTTFNSGRTKTTLTIAVNGVRRGPDDKADFYRVDVWGKLGDLAQKYLSKGSQVGASGRLVLDQWTDKDGNRRMTPIIEANQISFPPKLRVVEGGAQGNSIVSRMMPTELSIASTAVRSEAPSHEAEFDRTPPPGEARSVNDDESEQMDDYVQVGELAEAM